MAVSETIQDLIQDKIVCELGCAEGDNLVFMSRYAKQVIGFEYMQSRYKIAQQRGLDVTVGDYYKDDVPDADVYYFWPDDGERDSEYLVQKLLQKPGFNGIIIIGADTGFPPEVPSLKRCANWGELKEVPFNEGTGPRENGIFLLAIIDVSKLRQQCTWLLSAPRSGSSCTTACFQLCGLSLGKNETTVKDLFNQKGYFENQTILNFNEKVLRSAGSSIFETQDLSSDQENKTLAFKDELMSIIKAEFTSKFFMMKDPRISILQLLYTQAFKELDIVVNIAVLQRNKEHAVSSMSRMASVPIDRGQKTYDYHYKLIDKLTKNYQFTQFSFEQLLEKPNDVIADACKSLNIPYGFGKHKKQEISNFVDKKLLVFKEK
jgi:hypothetical protein